MSALAYHTAEAFYLPAVELSVLALRTTTAYEFDNYTPHGKPVILPATGAFEPALARVCYRPQT
ncbi:MAG: hypothetical protein EOO60_01020 [Hymenobacter sp.]|nr:MAG: hypothetical protein EOO60_01020 [Hymenobacter sp.]